MIKKFIFTFLFPLYATLVLPKQGRLIDSLQRQFANAKDDTSRINAQIALCLLYRLGNTDSSLIYGQQALESAEKINYIRGQIAYLSFMCIVTEQRGNLPKITGIGI